MTRRLKTAQSQLLMQLTEERERWKTIVENMLDPVTVCDEKGRAVFMNTAYSRLVSRHISGDLGLEEHALHYQLFHPDGTLYRVEDLPLQRAALQSETVQNAEVMQRTEDGREVIVVWNASPLRNAAGVLLGAVAVGRDVTEQRMAEAEILRLNEELKSSVERLDAAYKEMEAFSYSVSHDLRAPLRAMNGFARAVLDDYFHRLDDQGRRLLEMICSNARKADALIDAIMALSQSGQRKMDIREVDMEMLAQSVCAGMKEQTDREIAFSVAKLPPALGDLVLVRQVLENLVSNAVKYAGHGRAAFVEIGVQAGGTENVYYVRDNGVGFDMSCADRLFVPFQRLHNPREFEGAGIGLSIVRRIIQRHGGRLWAEGEVDKGATFYFTLPAQKAPAG